MVQFSHLYMTTGKTIALFWLDRTLVGKVISLLFNSLSRFAKEQASFNFMAAVTICSDFGAQENNLSLFPLFPRLFAMKWWEWMLWSSFFECWVLSQLFHSLSLSSKASLVTLHFLPLGQCYLHIWGYWYFSQQPLNHLVLHPVQHFAWCTCI